MHTDADCRWSKTSMTYTINGVTQDVPTIPVFDNSRSTTPCTGLQVSGDALPV
jgi:hypothetical protein